MEIAITVAAAPSRDDLLLDVAAALQREFEGALDFRWLAQGEAMDLILPSSEGAGAESGAAELAYIKELVASAAGDLPVDWCVQRARGRRKRMLIAGMDSTIAGQESIDEMAGLKGVRAEAAPVTERAMLGELDFESSLRERMPLLAGMTEAELKRVLDERLTLNAGARTLVQTMKAHGAHTVLASGGFTVFAEAVAARAGFAASRGNVLLWEDGRISGVAEPVCGREAKLAALRDEAAAHGIAPAEVIAVGDGANDLSMLAAAGLSVAYRAKPFVEARTGARIRHTDLTALLYFQGYRRTCFAA
ncbi:MAG: phosphoserine phosphatase SerB [Rhodomicrobium sp.]